MRGPCRRIGTLDEQPWSLLRLLFGVGEHLDQRPMRFDKTPPLDSVEAAREPVIVTASMPVVAVSIYYFEQVA